MGAVCVATKKNNLSIKTFEHATIKCKITYESNTMYQYFKSNMLIKDIKAEIAKKLKKDKKLIDLEIKSKVIQYDQMELSYLLKDRLEEVHINVIDKERKIEDVKSENKSEKVVIDVDKANFNSGLSKAGESKNVIDENSVYFLSKYCPLHQEDKLTIICQVCGVSICAKCQEQSHKEHQIVKKIDIVEFNNTLSENESILKEQLSWMNLKGDYVDYIKHFRLDLKKFTDEFVKIMEILKRKESEIIESFKQKIDNYLPSVLCYRDNLSRVNREYEYGLNNLISDDKAFMRYYQEYLILSSQIENNKANVSNLQIKLKQFTLISNEYKKCTEELTQFAQGQILRIEEFQHQENDKFLDGKLMLIIFRNSLYFKSRRNSK